MAGELGTAVINDVILARRVPFVYLIRGEFAEATVLYVGQTMSSTGALGRLSQHISDTSANTYLQRVSTIYGHTEISVVHLAAVGLARRKEFCERARDYREAVEYLVQLELVNWICDQRLALPVVSRVKSNAYCRLQYVKDEALRITSALKVWLSTFYDHGI